MKQGNRIWTKEKDREKKISDEILTHDRYVDVHRDKNDRERNGSINSK